jgi:hypothetical protein
MLKGANRPREGILATVIGVGTLVFAAVGVVVQLKDALNTVWEVETPPGSGICASCVANPPESPRSNARILVAVRSGISAKPTRLSRFAQLIAFCADARGPRATSGQDRAYIVQLRTISLFGQHCPPITGELGAQFQSRGGET